MTFPDVNTLRLCSILASTAFGIVFATLWLRNQAALHFALWASSSLIYAGGMAALGFLLGGPLVLVCFAYAVLGLTNVLPLGGVLALEGKPPWQLWMVIPIVSAACGHALPALLTQFGWIAPQPAWQTMGDATGLMVAMGIPGLVLTFGAGAADSAGRRMAGIALLCYLPAYGLSILGEFLVLPGTQLIALLSMLSDQVLLGVLNLGLLAIPIEQAQRQLRDAALRDPLTGCWNRGGLALLAQAFLKPGAAVLAFDVDRFKQINDRYGHAAGDDVLAFIGSETRDLASAHDAQVVRLGGDEFVILLPMGRHDPSQFADLLQDRLASGGAIGDALSVSLGIATVRASDLSLSETIARADAALYLVKRTKTQPLARHSLGKAPVLTFVTQSRAAASSASR